MPSDLMFKSAAEQAQLVRSGEASARELVQASLDAITELNGELNAVVTLCAERALAESEAIGAGDKRPLAGVPFLVKDLIALTEGVRTTMGMAAMGDWVPTEDIAFVRRLREAGAILVGKTNTPEMGLIPVTEPHRFGPTRNPWDTSRTPGGSSGGSAAAVAAGMVALAHGNDSGGSIRIPASCCGLVGLKPSRGRVSLASQFSEFSGGISADGVLTRTVRDTAVALDVMAGYETGDPYWAPPPSAPFVDALDREPGELRIAFTATPPTSVPVHEDCVTAVRQSAELLASLGHEVQETAPDWTGDAEAFVANFVAIFTAGVANDVRTYGHLRGQEVDVDQLEPLTRQMLDIANAMPAPYYMQAWDHLHSFSRRVLRFWSDYDVLLTPTLAQPPLPIGSLHAKEEEPPIQALTNAGMFIPFTPLFNVTGQPAVSLPLYQSADGLPIGVQLVGPPAGEELLLSLSAQLEIARPWTDRQGLALGTRGGAEQ